MCSYKSFLDKAKVSFAQAGFASAEREALDLLSALVEKSPGEILGALETELQPQDNEKLTRWMRLRLEHRPFAYIVGKQEFFGVDLFVDARVLVPRHETEILAEKVSLYLQNKSTTRCVLWDICTGSGCLGLSLKKNMPHLQVVLSDLSADALALARKNAKHNHLEVETRQGDLFAPFSTEEKADCIVFNPPYLSEDEYAQVENEVLCEPKMALVAAENGLQLYRMLAEELYERLSPGGACFMELGKDQGIAVNKIFAKKPWKKRAIIQDWAGHDRFFFLEKESKSEYPSTL